mmetsp:Transcript_6995/g.15089  ORF Transcript_6995/g.15089 Transcript_6995/m.15089 type:complete len:366 (-) Transcript_6995:150-1247(-)
MELEESNYDDDDGGSPEMSQQINFTQTFADKSQPLHEAKHSENLKLSALNPVTRNRITTNLSRALLFKSLSGEAIQRKNVLAEALGDTVKGGELRAASVSNALFREANDRLEKVFGFTVGRVPLSMEESLAAKYKDRLYLINNVVDDEAGTHSINLHSAHVDTSIEKGVLMIVLAFAFCKGFPIHKKKKGGGTTSNVRWITEFDLYSLLHRVDENIPGEPPSEEGRKKRGGRHSLSSHQDITGAAQTPDIDALLEKFVHLDYLLKEKIEPPESSLESSALVGDDGKLTAYAMGPRAAMEIGRRQIIYFCSNVLGEQAPDPTMLAEIEEDEALDNDEGDVEEENYEEEEEVIEEERGKAKRVKRER